MVYLPAILIVSGIAGSFAWWVTLARRPDIRRELWPAFRFRPVSWGAADLLGAFFLVLLLAGLPWEQWLSLESFLQADTPRAGAIEGTKKSFQGTAAAETAALRVDGGSVDRIPAPLRNQDLPPPSDLGEAERKRSHGLWILLQERPTPTMFGVCFLVAVIAAPWMEETLFRLLLQGWLATCELRFHGWWKDEMAASGREAVTNSAVRPGRFGIFSILLVASCFSLIHIRSTSDVPSGEDVLRILVRQLCGYGVALPIIMAWLGIARGVPARLWGLCRKTFWGDVALGLRWFATLVLPIYAVQMVLSTVTPQSVVVDPLTLFPFGIAAGVLCLRSGRLLPSVVFHMALNGTSLALAAALLLAGHPSL